MLPVKRTPGFFDWEHQLHSRSFVDAVGDDGVLINQQRHYRHYSVRTWVPHIQTKSQRQVELRADKRHQKRGV